MCVLKSIIEYYNFRGSQSTSASEAFDRMKYLKLFNKLLVGETVGYIVRLLVYWCTTQDFAIK